MEANVFFFFKKKKQHYIPALKPSAVLLMLYLKHPFSHSRTPLKPDAHMESNKAVRQGLAKF